MGVCEEGTAGGEAIDVGSFHLGVSSHAADPVVQVIDCDEEDVGSFGSPGQKRESQKEGWKAKEVHDDQTI